MLFSDNWDATPLNASVVNDTDTPASGRETLPWHQQMARALLELYSQSKREICPSLRNYLPQVGNICRFPKHQHVKRTLERWNENIKWGMPPRLKGLQKAFKGL